MGEDEIRSIVQAAVREFLGEKTELDEERKRRESLEQRVNELAAENARSRAVAEEAERGSAIRTELQRLGIAKVDLAFRAVRDEIVRSEDGKLAARDGSEMKEYLARFAAENPELLPARMAGGSGATGSGGVTRQGGAVDLDKIRPGMSPEEMDRVRQEIARVATQTLRGF